MMISITVERNFYTAFDSLPLYTGEGQGLGVNLFLHFAALRYDTQYRAD